MDAKEVMEKNFTHIYGDHMKRQVKHCDLSKYDCHIQQLKKINDFCLE